MFKFENVVAENVRITDIHIRLIDYHKADITLLLAALVRKNCEAILGGGCIQPATTRTHKDPGSTLRKNRKAILGGGCIQPATLRPQSDNGSARAQESPKRFLAAAAANSQRLGHTRPPAALSSHNMSACTVSPGSGRGPRSRIRQAPSSPRRRSRSRIVQGSF